MRFTKKQPYLRFSHSLKEIPFKLTNYKLFGKDGETTRNTVVFRISPRVYAGGMCDRFKGMVSAYAWAKANGYQFRIIHDCPYSLSDYVKPAAVDWIPKDNEISTGVRGTKLFLCRSEKGDRLLGYRPDGRQVHFYGNIDFIEKLNAEYGTSYTWSGLYHELFTPTEALQKLIDRFTPEGAYVSASFRFMKLLGDFDEKYHNSLNSPEERKALMDECLDTVRRIIRENPGKSVLVTSDSSTFIGEASKIDGVFTVPGKRVHIQYDSDAASDEYMTCFLDFHLLSGAEKLYRVRTGGMYKSQFPQYAAKVNDREFIDLRVGKRKTVLTFGIFDLYNRSHTKLFKRIRAIGDELIVGVQRDEAVLTDDPKAKIVFNTQKRKEQVLGCEYVDQVVEYSAIDTEVQKLDFDVLVTFSDQCQEDFRRAIQWCNENGRTTIVLPRD